MASSIEPILSLAPFDGTLRTIGEVAKNAGIEAFAVGGVVRDVLLGRETNDLDFVCIGPGSGIKLAKAVRKSVGGDVVHVYENFGTAAIRIHPEGAEAPLILEFVAARKESYSRDSRKPRVEDGSLSDDQHRRDFTVNAMAIDLHPQRYGQLLDPFGGIADLSKGVLRTPLDPIATFDDDPLRIIRAARFACQLGFNIDPITFTGMKDRADRIHIVSPERIAIELEKIMLCV